MKKAIPLGVMDYEKLMTNGYYSVDKTLIIKEFLERKSIVTLITRPRRFGKTLNMSMLSYFFDITKNSKELFKDTKIMKTEYADEMNKYPTIFISFAGAKGDKESVIKFIKLAIRKEYERFEFIFADMTIFEKHDYDEIIMCLLDNNDLQLNHLNNGLSFLMEMLEKYYHQKVMLFIDEYDTPFIEAHVGGFYNEVKGGLASLLHNALKLSPSLQYAMLTGIQRVAKENIFSDLNNLVVCTVADQRYASYFGFVEEEVKELFNYYDLDFNEEVKTMYDGYHIGNLDIYNPWSIINYADNKQLIPYWVNTSANMMIKNAMKQSDETFKRGYEKLIEQECLETTVLMDTSFYEQSETSSLWGLFINAGYLTIENELGDGIYRICIPNKEVLKEFQSLTAYHLDISHTLLNQMFKGMQLKNREMFLENYQSILNLPSYHDLKDENSYHMMMLGMCAWLMYDYEITSNRENGLGRYDIVLKSKKNKVSYIMELKYLKAGNKEKLEELAKEAVQQIKEKRYDEGLEEVIYIGLAHQGKDVAMEWVENNV